MECHDLHFEITALTVMDNQIRKWEYADGETSEVICITTFQRRFPKYNVITGNIVKKKKKFLVVNYASHVLIASIIKTVSISETFTIFYETTQRNILQYNHLPTRSRENLKYYLGSTPPPSRKTRRSSWTQVLITSKWLQLLIGLMLAVMKCFPNRALVVLCHSASPRVCLPGVNL